MTRRDALIAALLAFLASFPIAFTDLLICGVPWPAAIIVAPIAAMLGSSIALPLCLKEEERIVLKEEPVSHYDEEEHQHV